jgi:hypothetical protein
VTSPALVWTQPAWRDAAERWIHERPAELRCSLDGAIDQSGPNEERSGYEDLVPRRLRYLLSLACA